MGTITIRRREDGMVDRARAYKVLIDGTEVGKIKRGEVKAFPVQEGHHEVRMKVDWMGCPPVEVDVPADGDAELYCEPAGKPVQYLGLMLFRPGHYIKLR